MLTRRHAIGSTTRRSRFALPAWLLIATLGPAAGAHAQLPLQPVGSPFEMVGFIQRATLNDPTDVFSGGTVTINNHVVVVPRNTILQMPATSLTWAEVFRYAPPPYGPTQSGLAIADQPAPFVTSELKVQGNRIGDAYIAGLMFIAQKTLQVHQGFISYIDYALGEMRVGGTPGSATTGTRVRINDPIGRFGRAMTPDARFTIDENNPTVRTGTAYPMCLPRTRVDLGVDDGQCPQKNRPRDVITGLFQSIFTMPPPPPPVGQPDARLMAPFEVGDYITYSGNLIPDGASTYVSAWSIVANVGIFTAAGTQPAYVAIDVILMGTGPTTLVPLAQEGARRTRVEGFTTDPSQGIDIFAVDVDPCTGNPTDRYWASQSVDAGPPKGAVKGRWRFRPGAPLFNLKGFPFLPPTREVHAVSQGGIGTQLANGLVPGQYQAPNFQFIFPENLPIGNPPVIENLYEMQFLAQGSGPWFGLGAFATNRPQGIAGQLAPFPLAGTPVPAVCAAANIRPPIAVAGPNRTVNSGARVTLTSAGSSDPGGRGLTFSWQQISGPAVTLTGATTSTANFPAPIVGVAGAPAMLQFMLTADNGTFVSTATTTITVNPALPPTATAGAPQTVNAGAVVTVSGTGTDPNSPPLGAMTLSWAQSGGTPTVTLTATSAAGVSPATARFIAPPVPAGQASLVLTFTLTVGNGAPLAAGGTATATTTVTVLPGQPPVVSVGASQTVASGASVTLSGTVSDPNIPPLADTSAWSQIVNAGDPVVTVTNTGTVAARTATFTAPVIAAGGAPRTLTFQLSGTSGAGSTSRTMTVTVNPATGTPLPPVVTAGANQTVNPNAVVALSGSAADPNTPPAGTLTSVWTQVVNAGDPVVAVTNGGTAGARTATLTAPIVPSAGAARVLTFRLTATNGAGSATATTLVTVNPARALVVTAGAAQTVSVGSAVTLSGTVSDPNVPAVGTITSAWSTAAAGITLTQGGTPAARTATFTAPATPQTLTFTLTASNGAGSFSATVTVTVIAATPPPAGSLVAAWGFNEAAGVTTVADSSGHANTGTISAATRVASQAGHGNALSFNGTTSIVSVPSSISLRLTTGMTLEAWVNPAALSATVAGTVLLKQDPTGGLSYALYANDPPNPSAYLRTGATTPVVKGTANLPLNTWTHIAATYSGTTMSFYVNGALVASHAQTGAIGTSFLRLTIGGNAVFGTGEHFNGLIDDVRIYNVALTAAQIQVDMTTPVP